MPSGCFTPAQNMCVLNLEQLMDVTLTVSRKCYLQILKSFMNVDLCLNFLRHIFRTFILSHEFYSQFGLNLCECVPTNSA